eukprot:CAMPEP_0194036818 /NCGR_PEP_ID=MMETSP0009_2-20130614/9182_1 /TAXON_ID=210454 /ORGANISM="Grammatophora oceanica, Strain CCMP 410" /LENGTH=216 /DNA_ID=CAMNT_0038678735 /DNA_START=16 /DNA_END=666 /DNA_ORIENTATION=+
MSDFRFPELDVAAALCLEDALQPGVAQASAAATQANKAPLVDGPSADANHVNANAAAPDNPGTLVNPPRATIESPRLSQAEFSMDTLYESSCSIHNKGKCNGLGKRRIAQHVGYQYGRSNKKLVTKREVGHYLAGPVKECAVNRGQSSNLIFYYNMTLEKSEEDTLYESSCSIHNKGKCNGFGKRKIAQHVGYHNGRSNEKLVTKREAGHYLAGPI